MNSTLATALLVAALQIATTKSKTADTGPSDEETPRISKVANGTIIREQPTGTSGRLAILKEGETVRVIAKAEGDFWEVQYGDVHGFVHGLLLQETERDHETLSAPNASRDLGDSILIAAAERGDASLVVGALRDGSPIESRDGRGRTALIASSALGHLVVVRVLVAEGADVNAQDNDGWTALTFAEAEGYSKIVDFLLARGGKWRDLDGAADSAGGTAEATTDKSWDHEPALVYKPPPPSYPKKARNEMISGEVVLRIKVLTDGATELLGVIKPLLHCTQTAKENAVKWRWKPAEKDGEPFEAVGVITVTFDRYKRRVQGNR